MSCLSWLLNLSFAGSAVSGVSLDGEYWWDATLGDDSGVGSIGDPFQTLDVLNSANSIAAGTTCKLKCGEVWAGAITLAFSGTSDNRITVTKYGSGANPQVNGGVSYGSEDYVTFEDVDVDGATKGVYANGGTGIKWLNGSVVNCTEWGIQWYDVTDGVISNPIVTDIDGDGSTDGDGIYLNGCVDCTVTLPQLSGTFARNGISFVKGSGPTIEYVDYTGSAVAAIDIEANAGQTIDDVEIHSSKIAPTGGAGIQVGGGSGTTTNVVIHHNDIYKATGEDQDKGLQVHSAGVVSYANVIRGWEYNLYISGAAVATSYNDTLVEAERHCVHVRNTATLTLRNPIIHTTADGGKGSLALQHDTATLDSDYCNFFSDGATAAQVTFYDGTDWINFAAWQEAGYDVHSQWADPLFRDPDSDEYTVQKTSPSLLAGTDLGTDYDQGLSPWSSWPDGVVLLSRDEYGGWDQGAFVGPLRNAITIEGRCISERAHGLDADSIRTIQLDLVPGDDAVSYTIEETTVV